MKETLLLAASLPLAVVGCGEDSGGPQPAYTATFHVQGPGPAFSMKDSLSSPHDRSSMRSSLSNGIGMASWKSVRRQS